MGATKYEKWLEPNGLLLIGAWARDGLSEEQIAGNMGIVRSTLYLWKKQFPALAEALSQSKEIADIQVENALHKAALGGDVKAMKYWLSNRKPDKWREQQKVDFGGAVTVTNPYDALSVEDLESLAKIAKKLEADEK